ncbi:MAG: hypothetical protein IT176_14255 [Acidobacteria bacterium]|nr:hypothetical protein [Acidobacteriota bacterium]
MTRRRRAVFAVVTVLSTFLLLGAGLFALDVALHHRFEKSAGLNVRGYRGPVVGRKPPGELRIVVVGGSTVLGYGLDWNEAFPRQLEVALNASAAGGRRYSLVNLGYNNEGAYSMRYTLEDYAYLDYDAAILYEGYNDLSPPIKNKQVIRRQSFVFRLTGYFPILPFIAAEKAMALRWGDIRAAYRGDQVVFEPGLIDRTTAGALEGSLAVQRALEKRLGGPPVADPADGGGACGPVWSFYCDSVAAAIDYLRAERKVAFVVTQPLMNDRHRDQQRELREMLAERYGGEPDVRPVDLGGAVDLKDPALCWDGEHLTREGYARIAAGLVAPVQSALAHAR